jgi:hypothetical protein
VIARRPSFSLVKLEGFPCDPPVDSAGRLRKFQLFPLSSDNHPSIQCEGPSLHRMVLNILDGESRTEADMIEKPLGSGPIHETNSHVLPPSMVRVQKTRPSLPSCFEAVTKAIRSPGPLTR